MIQLPPTNKYYYSVGGDYAQLKIRSVSDTYNFEKQLMLFLYIDHKYYLNYLHVEKVFLLI